ncbi:hypothetical protein MAMC_01590 [Methylacidimicrobium cyclopophantes]|uniref:Uncharacterized protein n=1 Tax=Methylacidimicrobium cyclopophantes TaxID=1041766 RepID=A0A5E6MGE7_9BACT|nr:hypothetical protein [Methylacidimicrobium cyclopophantes]VVM07431.1 hypothetical protein MAMC_01590 [Methylacidimicrobium cyclopophantes]
MGVWSKRILIAHFLTGWALFSTPFAQARDVSFERWKGEPPSPEAGARVLAVYRIGERDVPVWSRMPRRPYRVLGVLRSFETVGLSHQPLFRVAQEACRRGGDAIVLLAPRHLPGSWIRGDDLSVTIHGERFTVLVLRSTTAALSPAPPSGRGEEGPLLFCDNSV